MGNPLFAKIANAKANAQGVYPIEGNYPMLSVEALKMIKAGANGDDMFVAEFFVVGSDVEARAAGTRMSWVANLTKHVSAPGNVKRFLAAVGGVEIDEVDEAGSEAAVSSDNPFRGTILRLEASMTKTKAGGDFTVCNFMAVSEEKQSRGEALYAELTDGDGEG